jgi:hypothetical protein
MPLVLVKGGSCSISIRQIAGSAARSLIAAFTLSPVLVVCATSRGAEVALKVEEPSGISRTAWPVTSGVPIAQGALKDGDGVALFNAGGRQTPLQTDVLSRWPDGSARWLLLDFQIDLAARETKTLTLRYGNGVAREPVASGVQVASSAEGVTLVSGPLQVRLSIERFRLLDAVWLDRDHDGRFAADERITGADGAGVVLRTPDGETFTADLARAELTVEDRGPLRACVRIAGRHASRQGTMFRYVIRLHAFRGKPFLRMHYTFVNDHQPNLMAKVDSLDLVFNIRDTTKAKYLLDGKPSNEGRLFQVDDRAYEIDGRRVGQHAAGWGAQGTDTAGLAVGVREFWQNWPKAIAHRPGELRVQICPEFEREQYDGKPLTEECQLYYYLRHGAYAFKIGLARTHELWATFFSGPPQADKLAPFFAAAETPLLAQCDPDYVCHTRAAGDLVPADPTRLLGYDEWVNSFFNLHLADAARVRESGLLNHGDWYNTAWDSWGNLEYDTARIWFVQYLRTGDRRYFDRAEQAARHFVDVDVVHAVNPEVQAYPGSANIRPGQIWPHCVGHTGGYYARYVNDKYENEAPLKMRGPYQVGLWDFGHVWIGGAFDHYLLTGDRRSRDVAILASDTMAELCPTDYTDHIRNIGWPLHLVLNALEATGDQKYREAADKEWKVLKRHLDPQQGWVVLLAYGHCPVVAESGRCRGNNFYMLGLTLTALARYHRITGDPEVLRALSTGIEQMIREGWSDEHKSFYLTSCRHAKASPPPLYSSATFHASEAFAYESALTGNREHRRIIREALKTAIHAGRVALASGEPLGQTGYYAGSFHFPPFALSALADQEAE